MTVSAAVALASPGQSAGVCADCIIARRLSVSPRLSCRISGPAYFARSRSPASMEPGGLSPPPGFLGTAVPLPNTLILLVARLQEGCVPLDIPRGSLLHFEINA